MDLFFQFTCTRRLRRIVPAHFVLNLTLPKPRVPSFIEPEFFNRAFPGVAFCAPHSEYVCTCNFPRVLQALNKHLFVISVIVWWWYHCEEPCFVPARQMVSHTDPFYVLSPGHNINVLTLLKTARQIFHLSLMALVSRR